jgi:hypothetical protein
MAPDEWKTLDSPAFLKRAGETTLAWKPLKSGGESFEIPPQAHGLIRVTWKAIKVGRSSIGIGLRVDDGENKIAQRFEVPVDFIRPVWLCKEGDYYMNEIDVGRLNAGEERTAKFLCCSTTREKFTITPAPPINDPCILYGTPQPLTGKEIQALPKAPNGDPVLFAYRVTITLRERAGDKRLDIGPFHRAIVYKSDVSADLKVDGFVNGTIAGEVTLVDAEGKDFVDLGLVLPTEPKPVTFTLQARDPQLQLTVDEERTVDFLKVEQLDGKEGKPSGNGKTWQVRIKFRTDSLFRGPVPNPNHAGYTTAAQCSVVFNVSRPGTASAPARRLFVPMRGTVRGY